MARTIDHYRYDPSVAAAAAVAALYGLSLVIALVQIIRKKSWVWLVMAVATAMEVVGYVARVISAKHVSEKNPYRLQLVIIVLAPVVMAAVIYIVFSRIIHWVVPPESRTFKLLWVPPRWITTIFVGFDVVALILQLVGAVIVSGVTPGAANAQRNEKRGKNLGIAGVSLQVGAFGIFSLIAVRFHFTSRTINPEFARMNQAKFGIKRNWPMLLYVVNCSCLLILIRSAYREVQFSEGPGGTVAQQEWYLYVFDTLPILLVVLLYNIFFPGSYLAHLGFLKPREARQSHPDAEGRSWQEIQMQGNVRQQS